MHTPWLASFKLCSTRWVGGGWTADSGCIMQAVPLPTPSAYASSAPTPPPCNLCKQSLYTHTLQMCRTCLPTPACVPLFKPAHTHALAAPHPLTLVHATPTGPTPAFDDSHIYTGAAAMADVASLHAYGGGAEVSQLSTTARLCFAGRP